MVFEATEVTPVVLSAQSVRKAPRNPQSGCSYFVEEIKYYLVSGYRTHCMHRFFDSKKILAPNSAFQAFEPLTYECKKKKN
jgi:hypothetical protein